MSNKKISELPSATEPLDNADLVEIVQGGINKKAPKSAFGSGGGGTWGSITGTLSAQTDLQTALDAKLAITNRVLGLAFSDEFTPIAVAPAQKTFYFPYTTTIQEIWISLKTAQASGSIFTVDVHVNGSTILSTKLTIDNTQETSLTATTPVVISSASITKADKVTVDVDQIGNGSAIGGTIWFRG